jgi:molybdate transport system ATP-binding protein
VALLSINFAHQLRHFRLELALELDGVVALVGPSGAGKSTALSVIAGLVRPDTGRVALDDEVWLDTERHVYVAPDRRRVGLVFQDYALFPHMTVRQNVAYGGQRLVEQLLERFGIAALASARPGQLSGGERQRVALARALAREPGVLLLDEPLSSLDATTRTAVREELAELLRVLGLPTLMVTHDFEDAVTIADRAGVLVQGRLLQIGTPEQLVARPADAFVASFTGANLLRGRVRSSERGVTEVLLESGEIVRSTDAAAGDVDLAVHPWDVKLSCPGDGATPPIGALRATVSSVATVAGRVRVTAGPLRAELTAAEADALRIVPGTVVWASFDPERARLISRS